MTAPHTDLITNNNVFMYLAVATGLILLVPLVAMQFSNEVQWGPVDFAVIGCLLFGIGSLFILIARKITNPTHRLLVGAAFIIATLYVWAELAVGIFTTLGS